MPAHGLIIDVRWARQCGVESVRITESELTGIINTFGRTLAQSIEADCDIPACRKSEVPGYAGFSSDTLRATRQNPQRLSISSNARSQCKKLESGCVAVVQPGDCIPESADIVIPFNDAYRPQSGPELFVLAEYKPGSNIEDTPTGPPTEHTVLAQGTVIGATEMAILAHLGKIGVAVARKPRVAIVTTGADVVEVVEEMRLGQIRNTGRYEIVGLVMDSGCEVDRLIHVRDGRLGLERAISESLSSDLTIVALEPDDKHDLAVAALQNLGDTRFTGVHMTPGSATALATIDGHPVFVLPSTAVLEAFEAIIRPALLAMLGRARIERHTISAILGEPMKFAQGYEHYIRAHTEIDNGRYVARPINAGALESPNSLIRVASDVHYLNKREYVDVLMLGT